MTVVHVVMCVANTAAVLALGYRVLVARRRRLWLIVAGPWLVVWAATIPGLLQGLVLLVLGLAVWRLAHRPSFDRHVAVRFRYLRRRVWYRRSWAGVIYGHRLTIRPPGGYASPLLAALVRPPVPRLLRVECGPWMDRLTVGMLAGQVPADFEDSAEGLAHAAGCESARVRVLGPGRLLIELAHSDALRTPIPALPVPAVADLEWVPVGVCEDGTPWRVRLSGSHLLVAGVTGAGKGSVVWSLIRGIGSAIADGTAQVWALDPKGGMELRPGEPLFARFAAADPGGMAELLEEACDLLRARAARLAGATRCHRPTTEEPLVVVVIDELATLTAYLPDRRLRERIAQAVSVLLTQGRAVGVVVVAALQDPRKEVVAFRNLFPTKVALRLDQRSEADMVLGDGAWSGGARCDQIPESTPGVGYVRVDGVREPVRVRAGYVTDADIAAMVTAYAHPEVRPAVQGQPGDTAGGLTAAY